MRQPSADRVAAAVGFATFDIFRTDGAATSTALAAAAARELAAARQLPGFLLARVHTALDGAAVGVYLAWASDQVRESPLTGLADRPGVRSADSFGGAPGPGLAGPAADRPPAVAAIAVRHLAGRDAADALLRLLDGSGRWKRDFPGFITAVPYLSPDGSTFVNYPMWAAEEAYRAWMDDPRIAEGQQEIARLETAPPEYLACQVTAEISPP